MVQKYSKKYVDWVTQVLTTYKGYIIHDNNNTGRYHDRYFIAYKPGLGLQYANIPKDLYHQIKDKKTLGTKVKALRKNYEQYIKKKEARKDIYEKVKRYEASMGDVRKVFKVTKQFKKIAKTYNIKSLDSNKDDYVKFLQFAKTPIKRIYEYEINQHRNIKTNIVLLAKFYKKHDPLMVVESQFWSSNVEGSAVIINTLQITNMINSFTTTIKNRIEEFQQNGSDWVYLEAVTLFVNVIKNKPFKGSSFIELPQAIRKAGACINIKNDDQKCFLYSVLCGIHKPAKDPQRVTKYTSLMDTVKHDFLTYPVDVNQIPKFEKVNNLHINAFLYEKGLVPLYITKKWDEAINLLLVTKGDKTHWVYIKNINYLFRGDKGHHKKVIAFDAFKVSKQKNY